VYGGIRIDNPFAELEADSGGLTPLSIAPDETSVARPTLVRVVP